MNENKVPEATVTNKISEDDARATGVHFEMQDTGDLEKLADVLPIEGARKKAGRPRKARPENDTQYQFALNNEPRANRHNAVLALTTNAEWEGVLGYDEMLERCMFMKRPPVELCPADGSSFPMIVRDDHYPIVFSWFGNNNPALFYASNSHEARAAVQYVCRSNPFNTARDRIASTTWDGEERLPTMLFAYMNAEPGDQATQEGIDQAEYIGEVGKRWMIGAVARLFNPGCMMRTALVLEGKQNIGKTQFGRILGGAYFSNSLPEDLGGKDAARHLRDKWIVELGEMSSMKKSSVEAVKNFLSKTHDNYDNKYEIENNNHPRRCVFFGTTNKSQYLKDETGNTRFWPVAVGSIKAGRLTSDRDQLFAEAYHRYIAGEPYWFTEEEQRFEDIAQGMQAKRMMSDSWEELISTWLEETNEEGQYKPKQYVTIEEICGKCLKANGPIDITTQITNRVQSILDTLGWSYGRYRRPTNPMGPDGRRALTRCYKRPEVQS